MSPSTNTVGKFKHPPTTLNSCDLAIMQLTDDINKTDDPDRYKDLYKLRDSYLEIRYKLQRSKR